MGDLRHPGRKTPSCHPCSLITLWVRLGLDDMQTWGGMPCLLARLLSFRTQSKSRYGGTHTQSAACQPVTLSLAYTDIRTSPVRAALVWLHPEPEDNVYLRLRLNRRVCVRLRVLRTRMYVRTYTHSTAAMWIGRLILRIWMTSGGLLCKPITTTVRGGRSLSISRISSTKKMSLRMLGIYLASPSPAHTSFDQKFRFYHLSTPRAPVISLSASWPGKGPQCCRAVVWCDVFTYLQPPELATDPQSALFLI